MTEIKTILDKLDPDLLGVYRFIGFNQLTGESNRALYVGKSGDKKPVWDFFQMDGATIRSLTEVLQVVKDNGAKKVLIPLESKKFFLEVPEDIVEKVDPIFYSDPMSAALKSLDLK